MKRTFYQDSGASLVEAALVFTVVALVVAASVAFNEFLIFRNSIKDSLLIAGRRAAVVSDPAQCNLTINTAFNQAWQQQRFSNTPITISTAIYSDPAGLRFIDISASASLPCSLCRLFALDTNRNYRHRVLSEFNLATCNL